MLDNAKRQLNFFGLAALLFAAALMAILTAANPFKASWFVIFLAYCCIAGFLFCLTTILFFFARPGKNLLHSERLAQAMREAFLLSFFVVASLILSSKGLAFWWIEATLFFALVCFELFFLM